MTENIEKYRRMELRRSIGNRALPRPYPKLAGIKVYLVAHACFDCRKSFKIRPRETGFNKCPDCHGKLHEMGRSFSAPRKTDLEQWKKVQTLYAYGFRFFSYRSFPNAPRLPDRLRDVESFVAAHPHHPFRVEVPNKKMKPTGLSGG